MIQYSKSQVIELFATIPYSMRKATQLVNRIYSQECTCSEIDSEVTRLFEKHGDPEFSKEVADYFHTQHHKDFRSFSDHKRKEVTQEDPICHAAAKRDYTALSQFARTLTPKSRCGMTLDDLALEGKGVFDESEFVRNVGPMLDSTIDWSEPTEFLLKRIEDRCARALSKTLIYTASGPAEVSMDL